MVPPGYRLVFEENFNGPLDVSPWTGWKPGHKWLAHTPYGGDFGAAFFTGPSEDGGIQSPFSVSGGILTITAYQDPLTFNHWRSGLLASVDSTGAGFALALGYWECRMKLPPTSPGVWPAFWLDSIDSLDKERTINSCEIDILEAFGVDIQVLHQYLHIWDRNGQDVGSVANRYRAMQSVSDQFRTYSVLIKKDVITFACDGYKLFSTPTPPEALRPMYCMVDLAIGGDQTIVGTPNPSHLKVDYIKCWAPPGPVGPDFPSVWSGFPV